MGAEATDARRFLDEFVKEFPEPLGVDDSLPLSPLSGKVSPDEIRGESLDLALRLLAARNAPPVLSSALSHAALVELLKTDLTPYHLPLDPEQDSLLLQSDPLQRLFFNKLREMEDRHVALAEFNQLFGLQDAVHRGYFAVFDGHGGVDAATYAATHLHVVLGYHDDLKIDPSSVLKRAFTRTDHMFREKAKRERLRSGSTGVAVMLAGDWLHVAWLGDSQVMLVRQGEPITLMEPHKPEREDEKKRIEDLGGCIAFMGCWRVNGTYAVSRAIGDFDQKPYISSEADCSSVQLSGDEDYVLLACDGFFDAVRPADVPGAGAGRPTADGGGGGDPVAQLLVGQAKSAGSSDNITVLLVFLRDPTLLLQEATPPHCPRPRHRSIHLQRPPEGGTSGPVGPNCSQTNQALTSPQLCSRVR
ncbi:hypothetical protein SKAU_G00006310 [Synaphobranchus kaupii]|uniref:Protein phosphatase 1E n=1 Tax=Synaphobranchus kaupii TaxID=118154 RepID=A0A9Q1GA17_SYNKA|nr:hypothetical protein SKAU_G00006310 [Synaphobranchus kaupii]